MTIRCKTNILWIIKMAKYVFAMLVVYPLVITIWYMSGKLKRSKHKHRQKTIKDNMVNKYSSAEEEAPNINNVFPGRKYKVISKPSKWGGNHCCFVDQIGTCMGTDRVYGAKLKFISGEICSIPFENIALHQPERYKTPINILPVVSME